MSRFSYHVNAERPNAKLWLKDDDGSLIDFSTGYTFVFVVGVPGQVGLLVKSLGITGAAGSGEAPPATGGVPNVTIDWAPGDLAVLTKGIHTWQLFATTGGEDRVFEGDFEAKLAILQS